MQQFGKGSHRITLRDSLYMTATNLDTHTSASWTKRTGAHTSHILCQGQRSTATQESKRLTVALIHLHTCHTSIVLGRGYKLHPEGGTQIWFFVNNISYLLYVHFLII